MLSPAQGAFLEGLVLAYPVLVENGAAPGDRVMVSLIGLGLAKRASDRRYALPTRDGILTYYRINRVPMLSWPT